MGDLTDLANSLLDHGQKTAISIMSREAYLAAEPGRAGELEPGTRFVVIEGNSRLAAAREAGLKTIKVMLDDSLGSDSDSILESALVANVHRKELDHMDEARALERLLKIHGTQTALAKRLHRSQTWVSHRLALLNLTPELQQRLEAGEESADVLKKVGGKKSEEQQEHLERLKAQKAAETTARRSAKAAQPKERQPRTLQDQNPVLKPESLEPASSPDAGDSQETGKPAPEPRQVPVPRPVADLVPAAAGASGAFKALETMLWEGPGVLARERMEPDQRTALLHWYFHHAAGVTEVAEDLGRGLPVEHRQELSQILQQVSVLLARDE
ncbi:ParB/RepB/Spo0J family partition protein [Streptomyces sp. NPDC013457]|uniref:ParB/RepB/Spo0J family partition protein n=1 Tax=Streptomyces sp. NPDC013457 TaxID=3364866 RepID=UPI0036F6B395